MLDITAVAGHLAWLAVLLVFSWGCTYQGVMDHVLCHCFSDDEGSEEEDEEQDETYEVNTDILYQYLGHPLAEFHPLWIFHKMDRVKRIWYLSPIEQQRFRRACASAQSRQNLHCSLIQAVSQEEPSDRKPGPLPLWMAGHAQLKFVMTECSKTQIRLTGPKCHRLITRSKGIKFYKKQFTVHEILSCPLISSNNENLKVGL